jgi:hypothetical protein
MHKNRAAWLPLILLASTCFAQVVNPVEIKDPDLRVLQQKYLDDLKSVGDEIVATHFEYPFYLSRKLDIDEQLQQRADQRSLRFDRYSGKTVLAISGNYYAAYSTEKIKEEQRARTTFLEVVMPLLKDAVPRFQANREIKGYAVEVSHHITGKVMGVTLERPENLMVYLPQNAALKLIAAKDDTARQAALLEGQTFLNAAPVSIWLSGEPKKTVASGPPSSDSTDDQESAPAGAAEILPPDNPSATSTSPPLQFPKAAKPKDVPPPPPPPRDTSPEALAALQTSSQGAIASLTKDLDSQAHFVSYAPPKFVAFRQGIYLELSMSTSLPAPASGSRYKLAAEAFDEHIAHLVRPTLGYFKGEQKFDGIGFSTTVHLEGKAQAAAANSEAVEFFFPLAALHCYETYDCTGQQLIDAGTVLINGERVGLDLQNAEASPR